MDLIGQKINDQGDISIVGRGKFDSIQLTKEVRKSFLNWIELNLTVDPS